MSYEETAYCDMTKYCKQERLKVYKLYLEHLKLNTQESFRNYSNAVQDFKYRFHKRFDPLYLCDEYDIFEITCYCTDEIPMIPIEYYNNYKVVNYELIKI